MSGLRVASGVIETPLRKGQVDVLFVSLGTTLGLRVADDQFVEALREAGLSVEVARPAPVAQNVRTMMLTDFLQAWVTGVAARAALRRVEARAVIYSTTTAAMFAPRRGLIRFDALAQATRPGRHGWWQRPLERRRLARATAVLPWDTASMLGAPAEVATRAHVVPVAIDAEVSADAATEAQALLESLAAEGVRPVAVTYAADASKKGLDRLIAAWPLACGPGETLLVTGRDALPPELVADDRVRCVGRLEPAVFRALVARVGLLAMAPRREDYGLVQLEALAVGARVVTTTAPGPYAALGVVAGIWPEQVVEDADDAAALAAALRGAIDANHATTAADDPTRRAAQEAAADWGRAAVFRQIEREVVPLLRRDH